MIYVVYLCILYPALVLFYYQTLNIISFGKQVKNHESHSDFLNSKNKIYHVVGLYFIMGYPWSDKWPKAN